MDAFGRQLVRPLVQIARRVPVIAWVLLAAGLAFWLMTRRGGRGKYEYASEPIPDKTKARIQRVCGDGGSFNGLYKSESSWSKFDKNELKKICNDAYSARVQNVKDGKAADASQCNDKCPSGLLAKTRPCMNRDKTKCCVTNGKDCVDKKSAQKKEKKTLENIRKKKTDIQNLLNQTNGDAAAAAALQKKLDGETTSNPAPANTEQTTPAAQPYDGDWKTKCTALSSRHYIDGDKCCRSEGCPDPAYPHMTEDGVYCKKNPGPLGDGPLVYRDQKKTCLSREELGV